MNTGDVIVVITPLVVPVIIGYVIVWRGLLEPADAHVPTTLFFWVAAPALIVVTLAGEDFDDLFEAKLVAGTVATFAIVYAGVYLFDRIVLGRDRAVSAFAAFAASGFNTLAIGLPVLLGLFGSRAIVPVVIATIAFLIVLVPATLVLAGLGHADEGASMGATLRRAVIGTITNPIVVSAVIGVILSAIDITLPVVVSTSLTTLGGGTVLLALVALGMTLDLDDLRTGGREMLWLSAVKSFVSPALALVLALLFASSDFFAAALVIMFCQPTAKTVFAMAEQEDTFVKPVAGVVALTTIGTVVVLPFWVSIVDNIFPDAFSM